MTQNFAITYDAHQPPGQQWTYRRLGSRTAVSGLSQTNVAGLLRDAGLSTRAAAAAIAQAKLHAAAVA